MFRRSLAVAFIFLCTLAVAQNPSAEALYQQGMDAISGAGPSTDPFRSVDAFRRSAELGYVPAQIALGYLYETGNLTMPSQNLAADWYKKAADQGDVLAEWLLGRIYYIGGGLPRDFNEARKWLKPAAEQGNPFAAYYLGLVMDDRDYTKAPALYRVAAEQGLPAAQYLYAMALKNGRGIEMDRFNAYVWFVIALDAHYTPAVGELADLDGGGFLTSSQISEAKQKARRLEETVVRAVNAKGCTGWDGELGDFPTPPPVKIQRFCH